MALGARGAREAACIALTLGNGGGRVGRGVAGEVLGLVSAPVSENGKVNQVTLSLSCVSFKSLLKKKTEEMDPNNGTIYI